MPEARTKGLKFSEMDRKTFTLLKQRAVNTAFRSNVREDGSTVVIVLECVSELWLQSDGTYTQKATATTTARADYGDGPVYATEVLTVQILEPRVVPASGPAAGRRTAKVSTTGEWPVPDEQFQPVTVHGTISSSSTGDQELTETFFGS